MKYKAIIFDLDKTLHAPSEELICEVRKNINRFLQNKGLTHNYEESVVLLETIQNHYASIELGLNVLFGIAPAELSQAMFISIMPENFVKEDVELITKLQKINIKKVIFNGATRAYCNAVLDALGIRDFFDCVFTSEDVPALKSSVAAIRFIAKDLDLNPCEILVVGDNLRQDILPAKLAGFQTLHVTKELFKNHKVLDVLYENLRGEK